MPKTEVCFILFSFLMFLCEVTSYFSKHTEKEADNAPLHLIPIFSILLLFLFFLPAKETPISWNVVKSFLKDVKEEIASFLVSAEYYLSGRNGSYSLSFAGYGGDGKIAGSLLPSDTPQITIKGDKTKSPLYLTGSVYDTYTGKGWEVRAAKKPYGEKEADLAYNELLYAFSQSIYSDKEIETMLQQANYNITYKAIQTKSLFASSYTPPHYPYSPMTGFR